MAHLVEPASRCLISRFESYTPLDRLLYFGGVARLAIRLRLWHFDGWLFGNNRTFPATTMKDPEEHPHRGRVQAQSDYLEQSVAWTEKIPPTKIEGHAMLASLQGKLSKAELAIRADAFARATRFINQAGPGGVNETSKSYRVRERSDGSRVDVVVIKGIAFTG